MIYLYANRLDQGQSPSNSATGLRSNLFTTQTMIPFKKQIFDVLNRQLDQISHSRYNLLKVWYNFDFIFANVFVILFVMKDQNMDVYHPGERKSSPVDQKLFIFSSCWNDIYKLFII